MALYVSTNVSSLNARRNLEKSGAALDTAFKRLASGLRINSAKDDAAGLQISDRLTSQINGLNQGNRNAQDGISFCQTAEGALDEMTNMYQRIRTLAIQAANGTNSDQDRAAIQAEVSQLCQEITRIGEDTTFGGEHILNKSLTAPTAFQVGANANETISVDLTSGFRLDDVFEKLYNEADAAGRAELASEGISRKVSYDSGNPPAFTVTADYSAEPGEYTVSVKKVSDSSRVDKNVLKEQQFGAGTITFTSNLRSFTMQVEEGDTIGDLYDKYHSQIYNANLGFMLFSNSLEPDIYQIHFYSPDYGDANRPFSATVTGDDSLNFFEFNVAADSEVGDRSNDWRICRVAQDTVIEIDGEELRNSNADWIFYPEIIRPYDIYDEDRGLHVQAKHSCSDVVVTVESLCDFSVDTPEAAQNLIGVVDKFIAAIDSKRAELGAVQNRLESSIRNQSNVAENVSAARSRIRDADFAAETAAMTQQNILQQASQSILSQANQRPQNVLSLLQ